MVAVMRAPVVSLGEQLVVERRRLDRGECEWLLALGEFDRQRGYTADGALSCVAWLSQRCGMARATAHDRLRMARELQRRPLLLAALKAGDISFSKARALTRLDVRGDDELERSALKYATRNCTERVEDLVRYQRRLQEQEDNPDEFTRRWEKRGAQQWRTFDGMGVTELVVPEEEHLEIAALIDRAVVTANSQESSAEDTPRTMRQRRADATIELLRAGYAALHHPTDTSGADRYNLNIVCTLEALLAQTGTRREILAGPPITLDTVRRIACDSSIVRHILNGASEPVDIGRKTKTWTTAQRRAIRVRDGGLCRFPGCTNRTCDIHHIIHWANGGPTSIANGALTCPRHHTALHEGGWDATGDANHTLIYQSPIGLRIESPRPMP